MGLERVGLIGFGLSGARAASTAPLNGVAGLDVANVLAHHRDIILNRLPYPVDNVLAQAHALLVARDAKCLVELAWEVDLDA